MSCSTSEDLTWLRKSAHKAQTKYVKALEGFQKECPHPEVLHWSDSKRYFNGYSYSGPRGWICTRCKLTHHFDDGWADHKLMHLPKRDVTHDEYINAMKW